MDFHSLGYQKHDPDSNVASSKCVSAAPKWPEHQLFRVKVNIQKDKEKKINQQQWRKKLCNAELGETRPSGQFQ